MVSNPGVHIVTNAAALVNLPELSEGKHTLTIYLYGFNQRTYQPQFLSYVNTVNFVIDSAAPKVWILSPENNATCTTTDIPLTFTINEQTPNITYLLDGNKITMPNENSTLAGLSVGEHSITLFALDAAGNGGTSQTVYFTITNPTPTPLAPITHLGATQSLGIPLVVVVLVVLAVGCYVGIFVYLTVRKKRI